MTLQAGGRFVTGALQLSKEEPMLCLWAGDKGQQLTPKRKQCVCGGGRTGPSASGLAGDTHCRDHYRPL